VSTISAYFGLEKTDSGCNFKFYKQSKSGPGTTETSNMSGSMALKICQCQ